MVFKILGVSAVESAPHSLSQESSHCDTEESMRRHLLTGLACALAACAFLPMPDRAAPTRRAIRAPTRPAKQYTPEQLRSSTSVVGADFSPDETSILYSSDATGIYNAYTVPTGGGG